MIVTWHPNRSKRVLLCAHYDTRPFPNNDPDPAKRQGIFIGANDGGSGTALLAEMGHHMPTFESKYGVDFVLFDGEELVYDENDEYFLGSTHFAKNYRANPPEHKYLAGVLFDMVADRDLNLFHEGHSVQWRKPKAIVHDIWRTAKRLGVHEFVSSQRHTIRDDHLPLNQIAKIPTCDLIDFDYGPDARQTYWHTTHDTPDKCSALSLAKVGWVIKTWLENVK
jgi:Zn-dependent M28 family amino/carboxypeptidase